jgi:transposase
MRFVAIKTKEQQAALMLYRSRQLLIRQRTMLSNAMRGHLAEFGIVAPVGRKGIEDLLHVIADPDDVACRKLLAHAWPLSEHSCAGSRDRFWSSTE